MGGWRLNLSIFKLFVEFAFEKANKRTYWWWRSRRGWRDEETSASAVSAGLTLHIIVGCRRRNLSHVKMCHGGILITEKRPAAALASSNRPTARIAGARRRGEKRAFREAPSGIQTLGEMCTLRCSKSLMLFLFSGCKVNYVRLSSERNGSEAITAHLRAGCSFTRCSSPPTVTLLFLLSPDYVKETLPRAFGCVTFCLLLISYFFSFFLPSLPE